MKSLLLTLLLLGPALARAECPGIDITDAWMREPPPGASGTAGYLKVRNSTTTGATLRDWRSKRFAITMLHETVQVGERMSMRHRETLEVPAGGTATLVPGGLHLMLMGPTAPLQAGESVAFSVSCGDSSLSFTATVRTDEAPAP